VPPARLGGYTCGFCRHGLIFNRLAASRHDLRRSVGGWRGGESSTRPSMIVPFVANPALALDLVGLVLASISAGTTPTPSTCAKVSPSPPAPPSCPTPVSQFPPRPSSACSRPTRRRPRLGRHRSRWPEALGLPASPVPRLLSTVGDSKRSINWSAALAHSFGNAANEVAGSNRPPSHVHPVVGRQPGWRASWRWRRRRSRVR
jgi:hypothetical protein